MEKRSQEINKIFEALNKIDADFMEKMKNKSFEMGVIHRIEENLTPVEVLKQEAKGLKERVLKEGLRAAVQIDTGAEEDAWWEGYMTAGKYFKSLRKKTLEVKE